MLAWRKEFTLNLYTAFATPEPFFFTMIWAASTLDIMHSNGLISVLQKVSFPLLVIVIILAGIMYGVLLADSTGIELGKQAGSDYKRDVTVRLAMVLMFSSFVTSLPEFKLKVFS